MLQGVLGREDYEPSLILYTGVVVRYCLVCQRHLRNTSVINPHSSAILQQGLV